MKANISRVVFGTVAALLASGVLAQAGTNGGATEEPEYTWNAMQGEKLQALRAKGDPARGEITFEICQGCHRARALGRTDGSYPRLAGQHDTVLIKQMTDVRAGRRKNDKMLPFIERHAVSPQDIADIAAYLSKLPVPANNGQGPGNDLATAERIYADKCVSCHGAAGEGDANEFYPRLSGQHYKYLVREMTDIRDGSRLNANPRMVEVVKGMPDSMVQIVSDYISRLPVGGAK